MAKKTSKFAVTRLHYDALVERARHLEVKRNEAVKESEERGARIRTLEDLNRLLEVRIANLMTEASKRAQDLEETGWERNVLFTALSREMDRDE